MFAVIDDVHIENSSSVTAVAIATQCNGVSDGHEVIQGVVYSTVALCSAVRNSMQYSLWTATRQQCVSRNHAKLCAARCSTLAVAHEKHSTSHCLRTTGVMLHEGAYRFWQCSTRMKCWLKYCCRCERYCRAARSDTTHFEQL
jgi:hypothetical protein